MNKYDLIANSIDKLQDLENKVKQCKQELMTNISNLTIEDYKNLEFENLWNLYQRIKYYNCFQPIKEDVKNILIEKRNSLYPEYKKAIYYPELNQLNENNETIHLIDETISKYRKGDYLLTGSSLVRPIIQYLDKLVELDICEEVYVLEYLDDDFDEYKTEIHLVTKEEYLKHKRVWELYSLIKKEEDIQDKYREELDKLEMEGFGYIYLTNGEEINDDNDFQHYLSNIRYKLIKDSNISLIKFLID